MSVRESQAEPAPPPHDNRPGRNGAPPYPAEKARGGEIILRTPVHRIIFIAGLLGIAAVLLAVGLFA